MRNGRRNYPKTWQVGEVVPSTTLEVCLNSNPPNTSLTRTALPNAMALPSRDRQGAVANWVSDNLGISPDDLQAEVLNATENRLLLLCTRQWGKSTIAAAKALHHALTTPNAFILVASASKRQSKELVLKFNEFAQRALGKSPKSEGDGYRLPNRARIVPLPQSPDKVRCYSAPTLIIIDEAAFVKDELYEALTPALATSNGALWLLSTAGEKKGFFHKTWVGRANDWKLVKATADDCPRISSQFLAGERIAKGEVTYLREYYCEFHSGRHQFVDESYLEAIFDSDFKALGE